MPLLVVCGSAFRRWHVPEAGGFGGTWLGNQWLNFGMWHAETRFPNLGLQERVPATWKCVFVKSGHPRSLYEPSATNTLRQGYYNWLRSGKDPEVAATRSDASLVAV